MREGVRADWCPFYHSIVTLGEKVFVEIPKQRWDAIVKIFWSSGNRAYGGDPILEAPLKENLTVLAWFGHKQSSLNWRTYLIGAFEGKSWQIWALDWTFVVFSLTYVTGTVTRLELHRWKSPIPSITLMHYRDCCCFMIDPLLIWTASIFWMKQTIFLSIYQKTFRFHVETGKRISKVDCLICLSVTQITGTALVLDEIINHVQSLQRQVEVQHSLHRKLLFPFVIFKIRWNNDATMIPSTEALWFSVPVDETGGGQPEDRLRRSRQLFNGGGNASISWDKG